MFSKFTSVSVAALLSFAGLTCGAASTDISSVMICTDNIYADGELTPDHERYEQDPQTKTNTVLGRLHLPQHHW